LAGGSGNPTELFLNWNAATDNVGVSGYYVFRNGENIGTTGTLYYQDSGLTEATVYTYMLEAFDLAGNVSLPSAPVDVQTTNVTPPTTPGNVVANAVACTKAIVTWSASTDNTGVTEYLVWMGLSPNSLAQVAVVGGSTTSYGDNTLSAATTYYFGVQAEDKNRNISAMSAIASATTPALPVAPSGVLAEADSTSKISVTWSASTGGLPIARYLVYRGASVATLAQVAVVINTSYTDTSAAASTTYYYAVEAVDSGTPPAQSGLSLPASATTFSPPSAPANVTATPVSSSKIDLTWSASTSGGLPIANYHVYGGTSPSSLSQIVITLNTSYNNVSLTAGTTYYYAVQAADTAYDDSALSNTVAATTLQLPSAPSNVVAQGTSSSEIAVSWSPSSGALPIAYYYVFRGASPSNMSQVATTVNPSYNDKSLSVGTTYYYGVQAVDTAGDLSPVSSAVPGTTL
jgi:fibronectin type 3 domain-containing protein